VGSVPSLELDPYASAFLDDPYPHHETLREAGPVVYLPAYGIYGLARYQHVYDALRDPQTFCSGRGVGLADFAKEAPWRPPSLLLEVDPPLHDRTRAIVQRALSPAALRELRPRWMHQAESLVERLVRDGEFDAVGDLAEVYPLEVFPDAVGLPRDGREHLLAYGAMVFNAFGPRNELTERAMHGTDAVVAWVAASCRRSALAPGGLGAAVFAAVDRGEATEAEGERLVRSLVSAGVDTTVHGIGNLMAALAAHPQQWQALRSNPALARQCLDEALRYEATVQTFFRTTTRAVDVGGLAIPADAKVLLFLGAANRDPRQWPDADRFDVTRRNLGHVGFGAGIHACVGQMLARLETELLVNAMIARIASIELAGPPVRRYNNTLRALESVPVRVVAA
jgi:cytochrome P450